MEDIGIRPSSVDLLVTTTVESVASRREQVELWLARYEARCKELQKNLTEAETTRNFLRLEHERVILVQRLQDGDVVRVVCTVCKGTGLKPTDVSSGQIHRKSAFESIGDAVLTRPTEIEAKDRCLGCEGRRYQLMERYRG